MRRNSAYSLCYIIVMIVLGSHESSSLSIVDPVILGKQTLKLRKADSRVNRITALLTEKDTLSSARQKELTNLLKCDTYDPSSFSESHRLFKVDHNNVFAAVGLFCSLENEKDHSEPGKMPDDRPVFYLDGFDGQTTKNLRLKGFHERECFTANLFADTVAVLKDVHRAVTYHGQAHDSLSTVFSSVPFCAYYLDGCSGSSQALIDILASVFIDSRLSPPLPTPIEQKRSVELGPESAITEITEMAVNLSPNFAVGFTLTNAGGKDPRSLVDREQEVTKYINKMSRKYGYSMTYVGDEPELYGIDFTVMKRDGDVQTTWVMLRR